VSRGSGNRDSPHGDCRSDPGNLDIQIPEGMAPMIKAIFPHEDAGTIKATDTVEIKEPTLQELAADFGEMHELLMGLVNDVNKLRLSVIQIEKIVTGFDFPDDRVADLICRDMGTSLAAIRLQNRTPEIVKLRRAVILALRNRGWRINTIAKVLHRNHGAIHNLLNKEVK